MYTKILFLIKSVPFEYLLFKQFASWRQQRQHREQNDAKEK